MLDQSASRRKLHLRDRRSQVTRSCHARNMLRSSAQNKMFCVLADNRAEHPFAFNVPDAKNLSIKVLTMEGPDNGSITKAYKGLRANLS